MPQRELLYMIGCHFWVSRLSDTPTFMIECLPMCHDWISLLNLNNPITWFKLISSNIWYYLMNTKTELFFPSPSPGRWWNTLSIAFRIIWLVKPRRHLEYTRTLYLYIPVSGPYVNPTWSQTSLELFTTGFLFCGDYNNMYLLLRWACGTHKPLPIYLLIFTNGRAISHRPHNGRLSG